MLINNLLDGVSACYLAVVPTGPNSAYIDLVDNAGDGGYVSGSPMSIPSTNTLSNSQCSITAPGSPISMGGQSLSLTLTITFTSAFAGNKAIYAAARGALGGNSGWQPVGVWNVPGSTPTGPAAVSVSPTRGPDQVNADGSTTMTFNFSDTNGYSSLTVLDVLINTYLDGTTACYFALVPTGSTRFSF